MATAQIPWRAKVHRLLEERGLSVRALAQRMGRQERTVRYWLQGEREPLRETHVVAQIAAALEVPSDWLLDGEDSAAPEGAVPRDMEALAKMVPAKFRRLAFALADAETAEWMLGALDLYERARKRERSRRA